jgi:cell division protein FtsN
MAVALGLIVLLLAGLFLFENKEAPPPASEPAKPPLPQVVMGQVRSVAQTEMQKLPTAPDTTETAKVPPVPPVTGETAPEAPKPAVPLTSKPAQYRPQTSPTPTVSTATQAAPSAAPSAAAAPASVTPPHATIKPGASSAYLLHIGGFGSVAEAEAIRAKLLAAGIPSGIEARVRVGPFADQNAAIAARTRLQALGLDASLILPARK